MGHDKIYKSEIHSNTNRNATRTTWNILTEANVYNKKDTIKLLNNNFSFNLTDYTSSEH